MLKNFTILKLASILLPLSLVKTATTRVGTRRGKLILIVDDEPACRLALEEVLRGSGHDVHGVATREEAEDLVLRHRYDVALLDNRLSGSDSTHEGLDLLCRIRARCSETRVILITGYGSALLESTARDLGAAGYLEKPIPLERILEEMTRFGVESGP